MPKLSKRRKQLKEIYTSRKQDDGFEFSNEGVELTKPSTSQQQPAPKKAKTSANHALSVTNQAAKKETEEDDRAWVQCNTCDKWRALPKTVDLETLPDVWSCSLNVWDPVRMSCDAPEESYVDVADEPLKNFFKKWVKRLKNAERAEQRLPPTASTRNRKRKPECEWIRCCNPTCGKWRAISVRGMDSAAMLNRLNARGKWGGRTVDWYCAMNTWDETTASCAAPQEPLYDASWNLGLADINGMI